MSFPTRDEINADNEGVDDLWASFARSGTSCSPCDLEARGEALKAALDGWCTNEEALLKFICSKQALKGQPSTY